MAGRYYRKCRKDGRNTRGITNTYLVGFCDGIKEVLDRQYTALMLTVPEEVENSFQEYSKEFYKKKHKPAASNDRGAYQTGKADGKFSKMPAACASCRLENCARQYRMR